MGAALHSFTTGFPSFLTFSIAAGLMLFASCVIYVIVTPMQELKLLREGNASAGLAFGGVIIGLAIPISACLASSISLFELIIWGTVALALQLLSFSVVDLLLKDLPRRIENDEAGAAVVLVAVKIAVALIFAAALTDPVLV